MAALPAPAAKGIAAAPAPKAVGAGPVANAGFTLCAPGAVGARLLPAPKGDGPPNADPGAPMPPKLGCVGPAAEKLKGRTPPRAEKLPPPPVPIGFVAELSPEGAIWPRPPVGKAVPREGGGETSVCMSSCLCERPAAAGAVLVLVAVVPKLAD